MAKKNGPVHQHGTTTKKQKPKFRARNEFRYNHSKRAKNHPHYVFGEYGDRLASFGLTTSPKQQYPHTELTSNPDPKPKNGKKSYIQHDYHLTHANAYDSKPLQGWQFDEADLSVVRRLKKKARKAIRKKK